MSKPTIFYISLTGMTEPLGRSQVLEYLIDLSKTNKIYLFSFEREKDLSEIEQILEITQENNIYWEYKVYSNKYGLFSALSQIIKAIFIGSRIIKKHSINIIHARSMIPATIGWLLKKRHKVKLLFDIRGFAIDEKVDSGRLKKKSFLFKLLKKLDNQLYKEADHIVTLTHKAKEILNNTLLISIDKITVIPTCANKKVFRVIKKEEQINFKKSLGYNESDQTIIHTGTVSGWYDFDAELKLVKEMMRQDENIKFLVLNKNEKDLIFKKFDEFGLSKDKINLLESSFEDVHKYLNIATASIFFIKESFSKQASAPTKFAENVACKLPSITNGNVGDMEFYLEQYNVWKIVNLKHLKENPKRVATDVLQYIELADKTIPDYEILFNTHFDKDIAVTKYNQIYQKLLNDT